MAGRVDVIPVPGIPRVNSGDKIGKIISRCVSEDGIPLSEGDVIVVAQTIVSRSEGAIVKLDGVNPSDEALGYADVTGKDPRLVEVVLEESNSVLYAGPGFMVCETRNGSVCANAGVDASNVDEGWVSTLPPCPDASAARIAGEIWEEMGLEVPVIISDSEGRPFRRGAVGVAVGIHGMEPVRALAGIEDYFGRPLQTTEIGLADMISSAASLVMGESGEGIPAVIVRGVELWPGSGIGGLLYEEDVFKEMIGRNKL
jgi:coenzyme F420-0:L-glutamate ligase/coenzyme F420-1:gamma-L-glutamate ligase